MTPRHFAWQAWHLVTSTFVSRGRRGTISRPPWFCVAGVALMALGGVLGPGLVARDAAALCVAGMALGDIHLRFTWQGVAQSHVPPWFCVAGVALMALGGVLGPGLVARDAAALCVAGVALGDIHLRFTWQAWHNLTSTWFCVAGVAPSLTHHLFHTPLCHTPSFTHHFVTHHL